MVREIVLIFIVSVDITLESRAQKYQVLVGFLEI